MKASNRWLRRAWIAAVIACAAAHDRMFTLEAVGLIISLIFAVIGMWKEEQDVPTI